jgi:PTH1 family peptidyl-tRNA hydrolase
MVVGDMYLIVGLGNPGKEYSETRHNVGFMVINRLSQRWQIPVDKKKFESRFGSGSFHQNPILLMKPQTYMNLSGTAVRSAMDFYKIEPDRLIVILDDMALPVGQVRIRKQGSAGGHNGLSSLITHTGTNQIGRIRIGIGSRPVGMEGADYVLSRFSREEQPLIEQASDEGADAVETIINEGFTKAMELFNKTKTTESKNEN